MEPMKTHHNTGRRGVLLLVVLSMLTLFMMLAATYIVVATRARRSARAFANNIVAATTAGATEQSLLDQAFLTVVRGSQQTLSGGDKGGCLGSGTNDSLLGDKYGPTVFGEVTAATPYMATGNNAFIQLTTRNLSPAPATASALSGRVITLSLPGLVASTRILQATGSGTSPALVIPAGPTVSGNQLTAAGITAAIANVIGSGTNTILINGREFAGGTGDSNEAWDGVDSQNPLLAGQQWTDTNSNTVADPGEIRLALAATTIGSSSPLPTVDNDSDGFTDSKFVDIGLPPLVAENGRVLLPRVAILVTDLDGRVNVNVHGSSADENTFDMAAGRNRDMYPPLTAGSGTAVPLYQLPRGLGLGPADVSLDQSLLFSANPATTQARTENATLALSGAAAVTGTQQDPITYRYMPRLQNIQGRYGDAAAGGTFGGSINPTASAKPGLSGTNDQLSAVDDQWRCSLTGSNTAMSFFSNPGRYGSPPDLKGLLKVWVDDAGQPVYYRPFWTEDTGFPKPATIANEAVDDPYEVNLTRSAVRGALRNPSSTTASSAPGDSLFSPADLESLLRYGDPDTMKLSRRLVALSGTSAAKNRLAVTTESWDTPAICGEAWQQVINGPFATFLNATGAVAPRRPQDLFSPETLQGHKFDLNRPFHDAPNYDEPNDATGIGRRQAFARQLYCLLVAIAIKNGTTMTSVIAEQLAQYAVNVVDFRDADSVMTQFRYDPGFSPGSTGWSPGTTDYVWGCERPELLITETWAWHNRRTQDLATPGGQVVDMPAATADDDFDQQRRPQGAFFVELFSPWSSTAKRYDSTPGTPTDVTAPRAAGRSLRGEPLPAEFADDEDANGNGTLDSGEDVNGNGKLDMRAWRDSAINLSGTAPANSPIWRLVTVRGSSAFGTDPVLPATANPTLSILDPARPASTATVDRAFYFAQPSTAIQLSTGSNSAFWQQTVGGKCPDADTYVVVGTDAPFSPLASGAAAADVRVFKGAAGQPATITEPLAAGDPYDLIMQDASRANTYTAPAAGNSYIGSWTSPIDQPLDSKTSFPVDITSTPFLSGGNPVLMTNGTHDNFAVVHLQRLANPTLAWNSATNPYLTVDSMTVDLTVVNTADAASPNYDEPGTTGPAPLAYLANQKYYAAGSSMTARTTERGGKRADIPGPGPIKPAHNIWSAVVDASNTAIDASDAASFRTASKPSNRSASQPTPGTPKGSLNAVAISFPASSHTLQATADRFLNTLITPNKPYSFAWLFWPNRPFISPQELSLVPAASPFTLLRWHTLGSGGPRPFAHLTGFFEPSTPPAPWAAVSGRTGGGTAPSLWDFVHVPTPFTGLYPNVSNTNPVTVNSTALTALGLDIFPIRQVSTFREPGRINVNTIADKRVWRAMFGTVTDRKDLPDPTASEPAAEDLPGWNPGLFMTLSGTSKADNGTPCDSTMNFMQLLPAPGKNTRPTNARSGGFLDNHVNEDRNGNGLLDAPEDANNNGVLDTGEDLNGNGMLDPGEDDNGNTVLDRNDYRDTSRHAYFRYQTMGRLNNLVTTRSNVFAVWVTIGYFDENAPNVEVEPVERHRAFYIFDRSIPVGYEPGKNHNVFDAVLLRRIIQ